MINRDIVQNNNSPKNPLREISALVTASEFGSQKLLDLLTKMKEVLATESDGVALAAPQISVNKRIFVIAPHAFSKEAKWKPLVFINPRIVKASKKSAEMSEGCLSVRYLYGKTIRSVQVTVSAYNEFGIPFTYGAAGLIAHIAQHEIDHLDGILFVDHGYDLEEYSEQEVSQASNEGIHPSELKHRQKN